jgi:hypothetical protein
VDAERPDGDGTLTVSLDREELAGDIGMTLIYEDHPDADIAVQLLDDQDRVVAVDLFGNVFDTGAECRTDTFILPLSRHPAASKVMLHRVSGPVVLYGVLLYPVVIGEDQSLELSERVNLATFFSQQISPDSDTWHEIQQVMALKHRDCSALETNTAAVEHTWNGNTGHGSGVYSGVVVGFETRRGVPWENAQACFGKTGCTVQLLNGLLNTEVLRDIDILIISGVSHTSPPYSFSGEEVDAVETFVRNGGSLLCSAQAWSWVYPEYGNKPIEDFPLNILGQRFGFCISGANIGSPVYLASDLIPNVDNIRRENWWPSRIDLLSSRARPVIRDEKLQPMAGFLPYGHGRVAVMGHDLMLAQNPALLGNVIAYLHTE